MIKPKKSIEEMTGYFVPMYEKDWDIKIDSNENNYGPSPKVIQCLKNCDFKTISFYPFYGELSQKIADYMCVDLNNIKVTNGADEAIQSIIQTYLNKDDYLLNVDISFEMPVIYTQIQGGKIMKVPFKEKWKFPVDEFLKQLQNPNIKIVYIASPNNPTGNIIEENSLIEILKNAPDKVVIIDETYANYAGITYSKYIKGYDNVFIVRSFSKDFALAGMRLGYIISAQENIINLKKTVSPFSVNAYAMKAGIAALSDLEYFEKIKAEINKTKIELKNLLIGLGAVVYDSSANFLLADFKEKADFIYNKLRKSNISVKLFNQNSPLKNHIRITIPAKAGYEKITKRLKIKPSLVFDMDGVLIDARNSYRTAIKKTYKMFTNKSIQEEEIQTLKNKGGMNNDWDLTKFLIEKQGINVTYKEVVSAFQKIYWDEGKGLINNEKALFSKELIEQLSKDYTISIYT
ncbi:MAG: aminotransferase class I/II-fold pyridoxal phosphate-dependent enzyme, partial [Candidatus Gastranaerophilales bacterium]|nr:aminotransferase class I/II-fold pyridoxal phosphate-dependent enzyme [Candidatus Gastranaerophilales bacterium]